MFFQQLVLRAIRAKVILAVFIAAASVVTIQALSIGPRTYHPSSAEYTVYNNYVIFKSSFKHLLEHKDLYQDFPSEHWDRFKYTPSFSVLFAPFAVLPDSVGLLLWNLVNALALFWAIRTLPRWNEREKVFILWFALIELVTSMQNSQSNGLIVGLIVAGTSAMGRGRPALASLLLVLAVFIKPFALAGLVVFLLYPCFWRSVVWTVFWGLLVLMLPLLLLPLPEVVDQYAGWLHQLGSDHDTSVGYSVMGWLASWFQWYPPKVAVLLVGLVMLLLPYARTSAYSDPLFRRLQLAQILVWVVIFNHMAESPTFIIAVTGALIWYISVPRGWFEHVLFGLLLLFTVLSPTDLFPRSLLNDWVKPYALKAVPCIAIAACLFGTLMFRSFDRGAVDEESTLLPT